MSKFVIILFLYFYDGRIDQVNTSYFFPTAIDCARFKAEPEFKKLLIETFKDQGIEHVRSQCQIRQALHNETIARNSVR